jgi:hypothetical protein
MKRLLGLFCVLVVTAWADAPSFWSQLTPDERKAAGVDQLTPEQQAALDQLAQRFTREGARKEVEVVKAQAKAETAEAVKKAHDEALAEKAAAIRQARDEAKAEAKEAARKAREEAKEEARKKKMAGAGLAAREDDEVIHTRILGRFTGWDGHTVFTLENGQVWQQANPDLKYFPNLVDPEVELIPGGWMGWKLKVVSEGLWCKVKRIK